MQILKPVWHGANETERKMGNESILGNIEGVLGKIEILLGNVVLCNSSLDNVDQDADKDVDH